MQHASLRPTLALLALGLALPSVHAQVTCDPCALVQGVGSGTPGSQGIPRIEVVGSPAIGASFALEVTSAAPASTGAVYAGLELAPVSLPLFGATVYPGQLLLPQPIVTDGAGHSSPAFSFDALPASLCGLEVVAQAVIVDPAAAGGFSFTAASQVLFGAGDTTPIPSQRLSEAGGIALELVDLDGNGRPDLLFKGLFDLYRTLNLGCGAFAQQEFIAGGLGSSLDGLAVGDLTGDPAPDVAVNLFGVDLLPGGQGPGFSVNDASNSELAIGDFDGDGLNDLLVATSFSLEVHRGNPLGIDQIPLEYPSVTGSDITLVDLGGDAREELIVAAASVVTIHRFDPLGDPTLLATLQPLGGQIGSQDDGVGIGDLNHDGRLDIARAAGPSVFVWYGTGDVTFGPPTLFDGGQKTRAARVADLNGDGLDDLAVGISPLQPGPTAQLVRWLQLPDGQLGDSVAFGPPAAIEEFELEDMDQDGDLDAVIVQEDDLGRATLLRGDGSGGFVTEYSVPVDPIPEQFATGDIDGDGTIDAVVAHRPFGDDGRLTSWRGTPDGSFTKVGQVDLASGPNEVELADFDADGDLDAVVAYEDLPFIVYLDGNGDGTFQAPIEFATPDNVEDISVADLDADGRLDLVASIPSGALVAFGDSQEVFVPGHQILLGNSAFNSRRAVALLDIDLDGDLDLALNSGGGFMDPVGWVVTNDGSGNFSSPTVVDSVEESDPRDVESADLDQDGIQDLVFIFNEVVRVYRGNGSGGFIPSGSYPLTNGWEGELFDLDGDGDPELVVPSPGTDTLLLFEPLDGPSFDPEPKRFRAIDRPFDLSAADVDQDGSLDVISLTAGSSTLTVHPNR
ncbi:MAG: VCBS repeat-containing protein [Planctomycetota bacterium]